MNDRDSIEEVKADLEEAGFDVKGLGNRFAVMAQISLMEEAE